MAYMIPTADNTVIRASTNYFTADGADLINGGGASIPEHPQAKGGLAYSVSEPLPLGYFTPNR